MVRTSTTLLLCSVCLALSGCGSTSVTKISDDTYMLTKEGNAYTSEATLLHTAYKRAAEVCAKDGLEVEILQESTDRGNLQVIRAAPYTGPVNSPGGAFAAGFASTYSTTVGAPPSATLRFRCVKGAQPLNLDNYLKIYERKDRIRYLELPTMHKKGAGKIATYYEILVLNHPESTDAGDKWSSMRVFNEMNCAKKTYEEKFIWAFESKNAVDGQLNKEPIPLNQGPKAITSDFHKDLYDVLCK